MALLISLFLVLNWLRFWGRHSFKAVKVTSRPPSGYALAHHCIVGRNGGMIVIPRASGILWPFTGHHLLVKE